jgi:hypothetical protein
MTKIRASLALNLILLPLALVQVAAQPEVSVAPGPGSPRLYLETGGLAP